MTEVSTCVRIFLFMISTTMLILGMASYYDSSGCNYNSFNMTVYNYTLETVKCHHNDCYMGTVYFTCKNSKYCKIHEQFNNMNQSDAIIMLHSEFPLNSTRTIFMYDDGCYLSYTNKKCKKHTGLTILYITLIIFVFWGIGELSFFCYRYNKRKSYVPLTTRINF